uniref:Uncharacterized protein n=1 Tax=Arundo donax TaxID=35708 RepID=A0A0A8YEY1_ARUDO
MSSRLGVAAALVVHVHHRRRSW